jgi:hypothetical protein
MIETVHCESNLQSRFRPNPQPNSAVGFALAHLPGQEHCPSHNLQEL